MEVIAPGKKTKPDYRWSSIAFLKSRRTALHGRLFVIESLVFLLPALVLIYIFRQENVSFDNTQILMLAGSLIFMLGGLMILHRIFDSLEQIQELMTRAVMGDVNLTIETDENGEIQEVLATANNLMQHFAQANKALEQHSTEMYAVHELAELANRTLNLDLLLNALLESSMQVTMARFGAVYTVDSKTSAARLVGSQQGDGATEGISNNELSKAHLQRAISERDSIFIEVDDGESISNIIQMILPIYIRDNAVAILTLVANRELLEEKIAPKQVFSLMLREVAHVLENAVLHRNLEHKVEQRTKELASRNQEMLLEIEMRREMETALIAAREEAEAANIAKTQFLSSMSHEIRTPMNGVIGMVDLLQQTELSSEQIQMMQTVAASGQSLMSIIDDILDFSKIEANKMTLESVPLSITDVVEGSIQAIAPTATKKGLRLLTYIDPRLPQFVMGDPGRLRQIIINLAGNAMKFTAEGKIVIRAEAVENHKDKNIAVRFSVLDQGIGISEEDQSKLFQFFSQVEASTTRQYGGTGLGLAICKSLTNLMGGEIGVNSTLGEGAEFYSTIPFLPSDDQLSELAEPNLSGLHILVTNDDEAERIILRQYLEYYGADVKVSDDIDGILDLCLHAKTAKTPFDVVVLGPQWGYEEVTLVDDSVKAAGLDTQFVFLLMGTRHRVRVDADERAYLDVDPLRRSAFISAIAITAGRKTTELYQKEDLHSSEPTRKVLTVDEAREQGTLVLVAEDNATNRELLGRQLTLLGYTYEMVADGELALEALREKEYAMLVTDCRMPNMDGFELSRAIRQDEEGADARLPIIAITANALESEIEQCTEAGIDEIITKPIDMTNLRHVLNKRMPRSKLPARLLAN